MQIVVTHNMTGIFYSDTMSPQNIANSINHCGFTHGIEFVLFGLN